jgi:hypothetical protein
VEFLSHKNHFIHAYRSLVTELGAHPHTLGTDQGTEYLNKEMTALLESNYVRHVEAAVNKHNSNGAAEHEVHTIRTTANRSSRARVLAGAAGAGAGYISS